MSSYNKKVMDTGMFWLLVIGLMFFISLALTGCGEDLPEQDDTTWITTVDPFTGTRLSCFVADGTYAMTMHCLEVQP